MLKSVLEMLTNFGASQLSTATSEIHLGGRYKAKINFENETVTVFNDIPQDDISKHCASIFQPDESIELSIYDFKMLMDNYPQIEKVFPCMINYQACYKNHENVQGEVLCSECDPDCSYSDFANFFVPL